MTLKEFRLGNYFMNDKDSEQLDYWHFDCYKHEEIKPIPLTEEWLLRMGFSKSVRQNCEDIYKDLTARMVLLFNDGNCAEMDIIQDGKHISFKYSHIKYVHQLQNLYFALTGEELKIKNP